MRPDALGHAYSLRRDAAGRAVLTRLSASADPVELAETSGRRRAAWARLARALLADALDEPPARRLVSDYARFLVLPRGGAQTVTGAELQEWLDTWRPSIVEILSAGR